MRKASDPNVEYWLDRNGNIIETERNPCRCCENTYDITSKIGRLRAMTFHIGHFTRRGFIKAMRKRGLERLK